LDTAVGYVRKPVWLCGALGIVYWIQCNCNPTLLADADGPRIWVAITVADVDRPRTWCLRTRIIRGREICGSAHLWWVLPSHSYGTSLAIWDHTVLSATRHKWMCRALTPASMLVLDLPTPEGWKLSWPGLPGNAPAGSRTRDLSISSPTP